MAVRRPVTLNGTNLKEFTDTEQAEVEAEAVRQYGLDPSVELTVVASAGTLPALTDTRLQAGAYSTGTATYVAESTTAEPTQVDVTYDKITSAAESLSAPPDTSNLAFPLYSVSGNLRAMTATDFYDTYIADTITAMKLGSLTTTQAGTYHISTATSVAGSTEVSGASTAIFTDTRANSAEYTAAGIPETLDQPTNITSYYLHRINSAAAGSLSLPMYYSAGNIHQYTEVNFKAMIADFIRYHCSVGITYNITTSGVTRGSGIVDTRLTGGSGNYQQLYVSTNDYRSQEFPDGTASTITTNYLVIS